MTDPLFGVLFIVATAVIVAYSVTIVSMLIVNLYKWHTYKEENNNERERLKTNPKI